MNFGIIQRESLLFMKSDEIFLGNTAQARAVVQGDVRQTADKCAMSDA